MASKDSKTLTAQTNQQPKNKDFFYKFSYVIQKSGILKRHNINFLQRQQNYVCVFKTKSEMQFNVVNNNNCRRSFVGQKNRIQQHKNSCNITLEHKFQKTAFAIHYFNFNEIKIFKANPNNLF